MKGKLKEQDDGIPWKFFGCRIQRSNFLKRFKVIKTKKSKSNPWTHYLVVVGKDELEEVIKEVQVNLKKHGYYAHLYNEDGSEVIIIFPKKIFRTSADKLNEIRKYGTSFGIPENQMDIKPLNFEEEKTYYE